MVNSEASIAGLALEVDPEVPGDVHRHLARLPLGAGRVQGAGTQVPQLGRPGQSGALSLVQISPDTVLSLVEPDYAGTKVYAITTHLQASKMAFCAFRCVFMAI